MSQRAGLALIAACAAVLATTLLLSTGCGYHVAGKADLLPKSLKTIAIPAFANATTRTRLSDRLPAAIAREFNSRTRYRIVADPREADAVLTGTVVSYVAYPTTFDPSTNRASGVQVYVVLSVTLRDSKGTVLFERPRLDVRERYEIAVDQRAYLDESDAAAARLNRDVARMLVSAILENF